MLPDSGIMRGRRWLVNGAFLIFAVVLTGLLVRQVRESAGEEMVQPLEGFAVFCEGEEISALYLAEDGALWVGGRDGVKCVDQETGQVTGYVAGDLELIYAAEIMDSFDGSVWIGHNRGVSVLYPDGSREDYGEPVMTGGRVNTVLCTDREVLVGTMEGVNIFLLEEGRWQVHRQYSRENGLLADPVNVIAAKGDTLWFGSYLANRPGGISILSRGENGERWQYLTTEEGLAHPYINGILIIDDKVLVASGQLTAGGLNVLEESAEGYAVTDTFGVEDGIPGEKVRWLYRDSEGHLWVTTESDGLILCRDGLLEHPLKGVCLTWKEGLSDNEIKKIVETEEYFFLAGRYGLTRIEKEAISRLLEESDNETRPAGQRGEER